MTWLLHELGPPMGDVLRHLGAMRGDALTVVAKAAPMEAQTRASTGHMPDGPSQRDRLVGRRWTRNSLNLSIPIQHTFVHGGRDKGVLATIIGDAFQRVLDSDSYRRLSDYEGWHLYW